MKHFALLLPVICAAALLTGCASAPPPGAVAGGPVYRGYYGQGYYNETPPGTYYGPNTDSGPYYGGGTVAVVRAGSYRDRDYRRNDDYSRRGRRYYRTSTREESYAGRNIERSRRSSSADHGRRNGPQISHQRPSGNRGAAVKQQGKRQPNRKPGQRQAEH